MARGLNWTNRDLVILQIVPIALLSYNPSRGCLHTPVVTVSQTHNYSTDPQAAILQTQQWLFLKTQKQLFCTSKQSLFKTP